MSVDYGYITNGGTCSTAAATAAKTVAISGYGAPTAFQSKLCVKFTYGNTAASPTLTVSNDTTSFTYPMTSSGETSFVIPAGAYVNMVFNGTAWECGPQTLSALNTSSGLPVNSTAINGALADYCKYEEKESLDLNTINYAVLGYYSNITNQPSGESNYGYLICEVKKTNTIYIKQTWQSLGSKVTYHRQCQNGTWDNWETNDIKSVSLNVTTESTGMFQIDRSSYNLIVSVIASGNYLSKWKIQGDYIFGFILDWDDTPIASQSVTININYI